MATDISAVEGVVNHLWITVMEDATLRSQMGLKYLSHMWHKNPYWYLWFHNQSGVFNLELKQVKSYEGYDWLAEFGIKYYPHPNDDYFTGLSLLEQICRTSDVFATAPPANSCGCPCHAAVHDDGDRFSDLAGSTGAPSHAIAGSIPEDFFFAGKLVLAKTKTGMSVGFESQSRWQVVMTENYYLNDESGYAYKILRQGETDRDFPGGELTSFLYRKIVWGLQSLYDYPVCQEKELITEGLVFYSDGHTLWTTPSKNTQRLIVYSELKYREEDCLVPVIGTFHGV